MNFTDPGWTFYKQAPQFRFLWSHGYTYWMYLANTEFQERPSTIGLGD
jgi:hypothetical protein